MTGEMGVKANAPYIIQFGKQPGEVSSLRRW